jgi:hypothetical protein
MRRLYKTMVKHEGKSLETPEYYKEVRRQIFAAIPACNDASPF